MKKKSATDYVFSDKPVERAPAVLRDRQEMDYQTPPLSTEGELIPKGEEVAASKAGMRLIIETTPDAVIILDSHGTILFANGAAEILFGQKREDIIGTDFGYPVVAEETEELEVPARDGSLKTAEMRTVEITWEAKKGFLISFRDITERKRIEVLLREKTILSQTFMDALPAVAMLIKHGTREIIALNKTAGEAGARLGSTCFGSWPKFADACSFCRAPEAWRAGEPRTLEVEAIGRFWEAHWVPVSEDLYLHYAFDITDRKLSEEKLRESEARYKALFDCSLDFIYVTDFKGRFIDANDAALNRLGYNREEIHSMNFATLLSEDQLSLAFQTIQGIRDTGHQKNLLELRLKAKNGNDVFVENVGSVILKEGIPYAVQGVARDITKRKKAEAQLQETLVSLRNAFGAIVQVMVSAVEARDPYTSGHQVRSANLARAIAVEMGLPQEKIEGLRMAGSIHDIGKLSIPGEILTKAAKLSNIELSLIKEHCVKGYEMLKNVESPWPLAEIVYQHHERMDGSGYPRNLKGEEICVEARILTVADVVEAMASHRPYRPSLGIDAALNEIETNKGIFYDNAVADACLRLFREKGFKLEGT